MRIEGNYTFAASRELVWSLLHDPVALSHSLPGCAEFDQLATTVYTAAIHIQRGPFKGKYRGQIKLVDDQLAGRCDLVLEGEGPEGTISGSGTLYLSEKDEATTVRYEGDVGFSGQSAAQSPRMLRTTANALIRQFFEAFDRQVCFQSGIHTTTLAQPLPPSRRSGTIEMPDKVEEIKQDRRTIGLVLALILFVLLNFTGAFVILLGLIWWGKRLFARRVAAKVHEQRQSEKFVEAG